MTNQAKYTPEEYEEMVEKIKQGLATDEEKKAVEELVANAMREVEEILDEDNK